MNRHALAILSLLLVACSRERDATAEPGAPLPGLAEIDLVRFGEGHTIFNQPFTPETGLGPLFNQDRCSSCHDLPTSGGTGVESILKASRFEPPAKCDLLTDGGGDNIQERATPALLALGIEREQVPSEATARSRVSSPSLYGLGLIELIPEETIRAREDPDDGDGDGISGRAATLPDGRLGRFGRKAEAATIFEFVEGAARFEMGLTTFQHPEEEGINGRPFPPGTDPSPDPELDRRALELLTDYVRLLAPPSPFAPQAARDTIRQGELIFHDIGCADCHSPRMRTARSDNPALSEKTIALYSDMLLHDMGPESSGVCGVAASPTEYRTSRLLGLRFRSEYMHDGKAVSVSGAIRLHGGEAEEAKSRFERLNEAGRRFLLRFLGAI